jgi:Zn-dependent peptidase ImmA (M78 family)
MFNPWFLTEQENIEVFYTDKLPLRVNAVYDRDRTGAIIILKKDMSRTEERCILAHELGHHYLSAGDGLIICYSIIDRINLSRTEKRANDWAIKHLLPEVEFVNSIREGLEIWDIAERFDVTEEMVRSALLLFFSYRVLQE